MNFIVSILFFQSKFSRTQYEALTKVGSEKQYFRGWQIKLFSPAFKVMFLEQFINITLTIYDFTFNLDKGD